MKVLFHVQHLLGIGHVRRAALIAGALARAGASVTVAFGGVPVAGIGFPAARVVQLAPARAADAGFSAVLDDAGRPIDDAWKAARARAVLRLFERTRPDALVLETYPFGRRAFRFELEPLLEAARAGGGPLIASSVRDILVGKDDPAKEADMARRARRWFDLVLVHGDPALVAFDASFPPAARIADLIRYTGYVVPPPAAGAGHNGAGEVSVSAGGGAVGDRLLRTALAARPKTPLAGATWRFLLGPEVPAATAADLGRAAGDRVVVEPARPDFPALLGRCRLSISQAGYNTVMETLAARCRAVLVPFSAGGESEQGLRARLLAARGLVRVVEEPALTPDTLAGAVAAAIAGPPPAPAALRVDGADTSARLIAEAVGARVGHPNASDRGQ